MRYLLTYLQFVIHYSFDRRFNDVDVAFVLGSFGLGLGLGAGVSVLVLWVHVLVLVFGG